MLTESSSAKAVDNGAAWHHLSSWTQPLGMGTLIRLSLDFWASTVKFGILLATSAVLHVFERSVKVSLITGCRYISGSFKLSFKVNYME